MSFGIPQLTQNVIAIALILILATLGFMAAASAALTSTATTMADIMIIIGLLVGIAAASRASRSTTGY